MRTDYNEQREYINKVKELNCITQKKFHIRTFGCQMNESDSEKLAGILLDMGFVHSADLDDADFIIMNTCCVREGAEQKVFGHLGDLKKLKERKPGLKIGLCGCMPQQERIVEKIKKSYRSVDLLFGTHNFHELPRLYYENIKNDRKVYEIKDIDGLVVEEIPHERADEFRAYISIMYGCNNFCTYCIVPHVRGRERSRSHDVIINEVKTLLDKGYKEITLLGQNVNSYGNDLEDEYSFARLLREINAIEGDFRIRFMTSHPKDMSQETIMAMQDCEKICRHLHLPFQAGSSEVLKTMNRHYTKEDYLALIEIISLQIPGITYTTDVIVGFPGETERDFRDTLDIIERVRFINSYMFIYSQRDGTPAAKMEDNVPLDEKKKRFQRLLDLQHRISRELNEEDVGTSVRVLVEGFSKKDSENMMGRTVTNKIVNFKSSNESLIGKYIDVRISEARTWHLEGEIV